MTTPSHFQSSGFSIIAEDPLVWDDRGWSERLTGQVDNYSDVKKAIGGYWSAKIQINDRIEKIEDWLKRGLGRHIVVYSPDLSVIWEGFVNSFSASLGGITYTYGSIMNIINRVYVVYSPKETSVTPPITGARTSTAKANDTNSQDLYGIIEDAINKGAAPATEATQARDLKLINFANPDPSIRDAILNEGDQTLTINCLGYVHWLNLWRYNDTVTTGDINLSTKITNILADDPNSIFSTDYTKITTNTTQVAGYEDKDKKPWTLIKSLNQVGDVSDNTYKFGVYANRQAIYETIPSIFRYQRVVQRNDRLMNNADSIIKPWEVLPGEWVFYSDLLIGETPPLSEALLRTDLRTTYIQSVKFTAPNDVTWNGEKEGSINRITFRGSGQ